MRKILGYIICIGGASLLFQVDWRVGVGVVFYDFGSYIYEGRPIPTAFMSIKNG